YTCVEPDKWVNQQASVQATNADGSDPDPKDVYNMNGEQFNAPKTKTVSASVVLTAPDSTFRFWTSDGYCTYDHPGVGHTPFGHFDWTWTLDDLKTPANRSVDDQVWGDANGHGSHYTFTLDVSDD
ncbi:MAG: hypothetical protein K6G18_11730, partial [Treponema sp.]|nr:hypothetical protein [Treponema sp.]